MKVIEDNNFQPVAKKYDYIFCFDCHERIYRKTQIRPKHIGHEVRYMNRSGKVDE